jgi:extracellular elastinolytic metalloproteinase
MGEGWSDAMADWAAQTASMSDFDMGVYVYTKNIRSHKYSTSATTNPLRYSSIASLNEVHNIGEVWANMLHNVHAALVKAHGFDTSAKTNPAGTSGNNVFMHLFIDSMAIQPCNPTFVSARNAWIQADANRYGGANKCTLWKAFASRGLGSGAVSGKYTDSTTVPSGC